MKTICGRNRAGAKEAAGRLGWEHAETDWRCVVDDPEIDIIDVCTPNDSHCEIVLAAAAAGKAILCEKPLAIDVTEAKRMVAAVKKARVANMVCHNYRRIPSIALAKQMIQHGEIGDRIFHFRARYAQDWIVDPEFPLVWRLAIWRGRFGRPRRHLLAHRRSRALSGRRIQGSVGDDGNVCETASAERASASSR